MQRRSPKVLVKTKTPLALKADAIVFWASWALKLRTGAGQRADSGSRSARAAGTATITPPSWPAALAVVEAFTTMAKSEKTRLVQLYEESKSRLAPLSDPLDGRFYLHRQFYSEREEVYSDWLAWVLEHVASASAIGRILGSEALQKLVGSGESLEV